NGIALQQSRSKYVQPSHGLALRLYARYAVRRVAREIEAGKKTLKEPEDRRTASHERDLGESGPCTRITQRVESDDRPQAVCHDNNASAIGNGVQSYRQALLYESSLVGIADVVEDIPRELDRTDDQLRDAESGKQYRSEASGRD